MKQDEQAKAFTIHDAKEVSKRTADLMDKAHQEHPNHTTDDDIETQAEKALFGFGKGRQHDDDYYNGYIEGAKWMRQKQ